MDHQSQHAHTYWRSRHPQSGSQDPEHNVVNPESQPNQTRLMQELEKPQQKKTMKHCSDLQRKRLAFGSLQGKSGRLRARVSNMQNSTKQKNIESTVMSESALEVSACSTNRFAWQLGCFHHRTEADGLPRTQYAYLSQPTSTAQRN